MAKKAKELPETLEASLKALEEAVEKLEQPELPLEESIEIFEWGTKLAEVCYSKLRDAEKKVEILVKKVPQPQSAEDFSKEDFGAENA